MTTEAANIGIDFVIARLTTLTNQAKIYGGEKVLARSHNAKKTAEEVFDILNRSLTAIHELKNEINTLKFERSCVAEQLKIQDEVQQRLDARHTEFLLKRAAGRLPLPLTDLSKR